MDFLFHLSILSSISLQHAHGQLRFNQDSETLFSLLADFLYVFPLPEGVSIGLPPATSADIIFTSQPPTTGVGDSQISSMLCGMMITRHVMTDTLKHRGTVIRTLIPGLNQYTTPWYTITLPVTPAFRTSYHDPCKLLVLTQYCQPPASDNRRAPVPDKSMVCAQQ